MHDLSHAVWRKSSRSSGQGNCVEVATNLADDHGVVFVRDSKNVTGPVLTFTATEWNDFLASTKAGQFDLTFQATRTFPAASPRRPPDVHGGCQ